MVLNVLRRIGKNSEVKKASASGLESVWSVVRCMRSKARKNTSATKPSAVPVEKSLM